jgi:hypothetical protein
MNRGTSLLFQASGSVLIGGLLCLGAVTSSHAQTTPPSVNPSTSTVADSSVHLTSIASSEIRLLPPPGPMSGSTGLSAIIGDASASALLANGNPATVGASQPVTNSAESERGATGGTTVTVTATCPAGQTVQSGSGTAQTSDGAIRGVLVQSYPSGTSGWTAVGIVPSTGLPENEALGVVAAALCA